MNSLLQSLVLFVLIIAGFAELAEYRSQKSAVPETVQYVLDCDDDLQCPPGWDCDGANGKVQFCRHVKSFGSRCDKPWEKCNPDNLCRWIPSLRDKFCIRKKNLGETCDDKQEQCEDSLKCSDSLSEKTCIRIAGPVSESSIPTPYVHGIMQNIQDEMYMSLLSSYYTPLASLESLTSTPGVSGNMQNLLHETSSPLLTPYYTTPLAPSSVPNSITPPPSTQAPMMSQSPSVQSTTTPVASPSELMESASLMKNCCQLEANDIEIIEVLPLADNGGPQQLTLKSKISTDVNLSKCDLYNLDGSQVLRGVLPGSTKITVTLSTLQLNSPQDTIFLGSNKKLCNSRSVVDVKSYFSSASPGKVISFS